MRRVSILASAATTAAALTLLGSVAGAQTPITGPQWTNTGEYKTPIFTGHDLTDPALLKSMRGSVSSVLYCPSEADDVNLRTNISNFLGGAVVDYFDTRAATPDMPTLQAYDCVYTWANYAYLDNVTLGDNLALYNDGGGNVILGVFCTYTTGNFLSGNIMTSAYSPVVSPTGTNHFLLDRYAGDGTTCIYDNVVSNPGVVYRDYLQLQGNGVLDGTYQSDGEICHAWQPGSVAGAGTIVYSNGSGASQLSGQGDWAVVTANAAFCLSKSLSGTPTSISLATGGAQALLMDVGAGYAGAPYLIAGSFSGPAPGIPWGGTIVPLNFDPYLLFTINNVNSPTLNPNFGFLNSLGQTTCVFTIPPATDPGLAGITVNHAGAVLDLGTPGVPLLEVVGPTPCLLVP